MVSVLSVLLLYIAFADSKNEEAPANDSLTSIASKLPEGFLFGVSSAAYQARALYESHSSG